MIKTDARHRTATIGRLYFFWRGGFGWRRGCAKWWPTERPGIRWWIVGPVEIRAFASPPPLAAT